MVPALPSIQAAGGNAYYIVSVDQVESLGQYQETKGVVLLGGDPAKLPAKVGLVRTLAPLLACVAVLEKDQEAALSQELIAHTDVLLMPASPQEIRARLNTAMQISELRYLIHASAQLDETSGLYNQHFFIKRLGEEMSLSKRHGSPVTCVILSISYFETYQDSYGYGFVSNMLQQVGQVAKEHIRQEDIVARLGDNELGLLLPRSTEKGSLTLTKRIIQEIEEIPFYMGDQEEHIHLKAGVASFPMADEPEMDPDTLIRYARHALHHARCDKHKKLQLFSEMRPFVG